MLLLLLLLLISDVSILKVPSTTATEAANSLLIEVAIYVKIMLKLQVHL